MDGYNQQNTNEQTMIYGNAVPPVKKKKKGIIILCVVFLFILILAGILFFIFSSLQKGKASKEGFLKALNKTFQSETLLSDYLGLDKMNLYYSENPGQASFSLRVDSCTIEDYELIEGIGLNDAFITFDKASNSFVLGGDISYAGVLKFLSFCLTHTDKDGYAFTSPELFDGYAYLSEDSIAELMTGMMSEYADDLPSSDKTISEDTKLLNDAFEKFVNSIQFSNAEPATISINGTSNKYSGYEIKITWKSVKRLLTSLVSDNTMNEEDYNNYIDTINSISMEDIIINYYLNKKGQIVQFVLNNIDFTDFSIDAKVILNGARNPADSIEATLNLSASGITIPIQYSQTTTSNKSNAQTTASLNAFGIDALNMTASLDTTTGNISYDMDIMDQISLSYSGVFSEVRKGKSFQFDLNALTFSSPAGTVIVSGDCEITKTESEIVFPNGTKYDISSEDDLQNLIDEIQENVLSNPNFSLLLYSM